MTLSAPDHLLSLYPHTLGRIHIHPLAPFLQRIARLHLLTALRLSHHKISLTYSSFPPSVRRRMKLKRHIPLPMVVLQVVQLAVLAQEAPVNVAALQNHKAVKLIELNTHPKIQLERSLDHTTGCIRSFLYYIQMTIFVIDTPWAGPLYYWRAPRRSRG